MAKEIAFPKADINFLKSVASDVGIDEVKLPRYIREAQVLKEQGVPVPWDLDPAESYYLSEITKKIEAGAGVPYGLVVYLNDRGVTSIPENDVPTTLFREKRVALNKLTSAVGEVVKR